MKGYFRRTQCVHFFCLLKQKAFGVYLIHCLYIQEVEKLEFFVVQLPHQRHFNKLYSKQCSWSFHDLLMVWGKLCNPANRFSTSINFSNCTCN